VVEGGRWRKKEEDREVRALYPLSLHLILLSIYYLNSLERKGSGLRVALAVRPFTKKK
jgi:hypothetical protein